MKLKNNTYDVLKWFVLYFMPALGGLVGTIGLTLNWDLTDVAVTIISAVTLFLGSILGISTSQYRKEER